MDIRRDALVGAARIIEAVSSRARKMLDGKDYVVATIGHLILTPNAPNAVPGRVEMLLKVRSDAAAVLETFVEDVMSTVRPDVEALGLVLRSEEHTSELQSLMRISYAVFCLKKKNLTKHHYKHITK